MIEILPHLPRRSMRLRQPAGDAAAFADIALLAHFRAQLRDRPDDRRVISIG